MTRQNSPLTIHIDKIVKIRASIEFLIPANPGSGPGQEPESGCSKGISSLWTPVFTGVTTLYEGIYISQAKFFLQDIIFFLTGFFYFHKL
jgi:hypothetical protein